MGYKNNSSILFFVAGIALFLFLHFPSQSEAINPTQLSSKVCSKYDTNTTYAECMKTLMSHPNSMLVTNHKEVAQNALDITVGESIATSDFFTALLNSKDTNLELRQPLRINCASYFKHTLIFLNLNGLPDGTASSVVHYAYNEASCCERALAKDQVNIKSVGDKIQEWKNIYLIALAAVTEAEPSKAN